MSETYHAHCDCGSVEMEMDGKPRIQAFCHCEDCRTLLDVPYHSINAWDAEQVRVTKGEELLGTFQHPTLTMTRVFCTQCGETLYNTNAMGWRLVSQLLIRKCYANTLPEELASKTHFFYDRRIVDVNDSLSKGE